MLSKCVLLLFLSIIFVSSVLSILLYLFDEWKANEQWDKFLKIQPPGAGQITPMFNSACRHIWGFLVSSYPICWELNPYLRFWLNRWTFISTPPSVTADCDRAGYLIQRELIYSLGRNQSYFSSWEFELKNTKIIQSDSHGHLDYIMWFRDRSRLVIFHNVDLNG